jgi:7,8-dihydropterin-6-yl-methyl-4-(beta-D-ribofuranosyl)aminobenzene 5'-phosphate synthase
MAALTKNCRDYARSRDMKITIIYDNTAYKQGLQADWGFSCLVEIEDTPKILFDTGTNGSILISNMKKLDIEPQTIKEIFISHAHFDHTGGLSRFLELNSDLRIYVPPSFQGVRGVKERIYVSEPIKLHENVFSTGELDHIEQSLVVRMDKGTVIVVGCSHPEMSHILETAGQFGKPFAVIGGLHGFNEYSLFEGLGLICPTHCTQNQNEIMSLYPQKYIEGGAGKIIEI